MLLSDDMLSGQKSVVGLKCMYLYNCVNIKQGTNGAFTVALGGEDGRTFTVLPDTVQKEASLIIRVANMSALNYEAQQELHVMVGGFSNYLNKLNQINLDTAHTTKQ